MQITGNMQAKGAEIQKKVGQEAVKAGQAATLVGISGWRKLEPPSSTCQSSRDPDGLAGPGLEKGGEAMQLTIEVSPDIAGKLKSLEQRANRSIVKEIERKFQCPVSIEQVAAVVVQLGVSEVGEDKIIFAVMVARDQIANSKGAVVYKKSEETRTPKNGNGEE